MVTRKIITIAVLIFLNNSKLWAQNVPSFAEKHIEIALRDIGHRLLLYAKDSTTRVLPIKKLSENHFQIEFESDIYFVTDTLINLVDRQLKTTQLPLEYIVSVLNCGKLDLVYGYEISKLKGDILPCTGRIQPKGCYLIQIQFLEEIPTKSSVYFWLLIPFAMLAFIFSKKFFTPKKEALLIDLQSFIKIGKVNFDTENNLIYFEKQKIELTEKEAKLLKILANEKNKTIDRELLLREIWENDGVIVVGKSLDVLVSKLRKKLEADPDFKLESVHGKGYKLICK